MSNTKYYVIDNGVLTKYEGLGRNAVVPDGVTSIGNEAFQRCEKLTLCVLAGSFAEKYAKENDIPFEVV